MKTIGIITAPTRTISSVPAGSYYDLTQDDELPTGDSDLQPIYDISDSPVASPTKTIYSNDTSDDFWDNSPVPCSDTLNTINSRYQQPTLGMTNYLLNQNAYSGDFYMQNPESDGFAISNTQQGLSSTPLQLHKPMHTQTEVVDLTMED